MASRRSGPCAFRSQPLHRLPPLTTDEGKLAQVVINLLSNAVKFSPPGSLVRVLAEHVAATESPLEVDSIRIAVVDQGGGHRQRGTRSWCSRSFRQVDGSASREYPGTGLGLALVKRFAHVASGHGHGRVRARSGQHLHLFSFPLSPP